MEVFVLVVLAGLWTVRAWEQRRRIALLGAQLAGHRIEAYLETLTRGYLRALGEDDPQRSQPIWNQLRETEQALNASFTRFTAGLATLPQAETRVSRLPVHLPLATQLLPDWTFDLREAMALHAQAISRAVDNAAGLPMRDAAYLLSAELYLMQHTCHWFCRSRTVASARLQARHKTSYDQVLAAVSPATRQAYRALVTGQEPG